MPNCSECDHFIFNPLEALPDIPFTFTLPMATEKEGEESE